MARKRKHKHDQTPGIAFPAPAPGPLELVQAFVNTIAHGKKADDLATARDLVRWFSNRTLLHAGTRITEEDRQRAIRVRDSLHAVLSAHSGEPVDPDAVRRLDLATSDVRFQVRFDEAGPEEFEPCCEGLDNALGALLQSVVVARREGSWPSLKVCARQDLSVITVIDSAVITIIDGLRSLTKTEKTDARRWARGDQTPPSHPIQKTRRQAQSPYGSRHEELELNALRAGYVDAGGG